MKVHDKKFTFSVFPVNDNIMSDCIGISDIIFSVSILNVKTKINMMVFLFFWIIHSSDRNPLTYSAERHVHHAAKYEYIECHQLLSDDWKDCIFPDQSDSFRSLAPFHSFYLKYFYVAMRYPKLDKRTLNMLLSKYFIQEFSLVYNFNWIIHCIKVFIQF